ncbi:MAG: hypothetical protein K0Q93_2717 [Nocardioidaceae bacterium]|nr:hypothetical protein [Nocardioidaceae bacterium]
MSTCHRARPVTLTPVPGSADNTIPGTRRTARADGPTLTSTYWRRIVEHVPVRTS